MSGEHFWDRVHARAHAQGPHPSVVEVARGLEPGSALDLGCGDGPNAVWLAEQGWTTTGVDLSRVALDRAAERAAAAGVDVRWERADLRGWTTGERFDLVVELFVHAADDVERASVLAGAAECVRPGGTLLVVGHHTLAPWVRNPNEHALPTAGGLVAGLGVDAPGWELVRAEELPRAVRGPEGEATVLDAVVHARRLA